MTWSEATSPLASGSVRHPMAVRGIVLVVMSLALLAGGGQTAVGATEPEPTPPPSTFNVFWPEERPMSDCFGALQRPNCGSEARGGWAQTTVFLVMVAGLAFIGWQITRIVRRNQRAPAASTVRSGDGDGPAP